MEEHAGIKGIIFLVFILAIIVGGFILVKKSEKPQVKETKPEEEEKIDIRKDPKKDYIYFENTDRIVDELDIEYKDVVINFNDSNDIASKLNNETKNLKSTLKYDEDLEDSSYDKLVSAKYKVYDVYVFGDYISLVVKYYSFDRDNLISYLDCLTYVFDKNTGNLYTDDELLAKYDLDANKISKTIKDYIIGENKVKENEELDWQATLENIDDAALYVDKIGRLTISVLVKSNLKDYNDDIILN